MLRFRISKYDPRLRDNQGRYLKPEWTSISDIGRTFAGEVLTAEAYLQVEDAYVAAIRDFLSACQIDLVRVTDLETRADLSSDCDRLTLAARGVSLSDVQALREGALIPVETLEPVLRAALRELIWFRLSGRDGGYVHFGYDYYVYFGCEIDPGEVTLTEPPAGLFREAFTSPYA